MYVFHPAELMFLLLKHLKINRQINLLRYDQVQFKLCFVELMAGSPKQELLSHERGVKTAINFETKKKTQNMDYLFD